MPSPEIEKAADAAYFEGLAQADAAETAETAEAEVAVNEPSQSIRIGEETYTGDEKTSQGMYAKGYKERTARDVLIDMGVKDRHGRTADDPKFDYERGRLAEKIFGPMPNYDLDKPFPGKGKFNEFRGYNPRGSDIDYSVYDGITREEIEKQADEAYFSSLAEEPVEDNTEEISKSSWEANRSKRLKAGPMFSKEAIRERFNSLDNAGKDRMLNYQAGRLAETVKDLAFNKAGWSPTGIIGVYNKPSVRREIKEAIDDWEETYGEHMRHMSKLNSDRINQQGIEIGRMSLLGGAGAMKTVMQGIFNKMGVAYHPSEAEKMLRAMKEKYGLTEGEHWSFQPDDKDTLTGITKSQCNSKSGWYWDASTRICRRGVDPNASASVEIDPITVADTL